MKPQDLGCKCHICPLSGRKPVLPKPAKNPKLIVLTEFPSSFDEEQQKNLTGWDGRVLRECLHEHNVARSQCHIDYATLCRKSKNITEGQYSKAVKCCAPHLERVRAYKKTVPCLALGQWAFKAATAHTKFRKWLLARTKGAGAFSGRMVMVCHSLFTINSSPAYLPIIRTAVRRCFTPPAKNPFRNLWYRGDDDSLVAALRKVLSDGLPVAVDIETAGTDPLTAPMLCIGVGNTKRAVSVPWDAGCPPEAEALLREILASELPKIAHNATHDFMGLEEAGFKVGGMIHDTMLMHWVCGPELHHDLQFAVLAEQDFPPWKSDFSDTMDPDLKGTEAWVQRDATELREYNAKDVQATALLYEWLNERLEMVHRGHEQYDIRRRLRDIAQQMSMSGMPVSYAAHKKLKEKLEIEIEAARKVLQKLLPGVPLGTAGGTKAVEKFFFDILHAPKLSYTEKGKPQLNDSCLQYMKAEGNKKQKEAATALERLRELTKLYTTYVEKLQLRASQIATHGLVHPSWKVTGTVTGRWASSDPNMQNQPPAVRAIYVPPPGWKWVACDYSQLEGRLMAALSGDPVMCKGFADGEDLYKMVAAAIYRKETHEIDKNERQIAKTFWLALSYGAGVEKLYKTLRQKGVKIKLHVVARMLENLKARMSVLMEWQEALIRTAQDEHYVEEPVTEWREYFHDGRVSPTKAKNFPCQASAAAIVNDAIIKVDAAIDWQTIKIAAMVHDEIVLLARDDKVEEACQILTQAMTRTAHFKGSVTLSVKPLVATTWEEAKD